MKNTERISVKRHEIDFFANQGFKVNQQPNRLGNYDAYRAVKVVNGQRHELSGSTLMFTGQVYKGGMR